jgi:ABC-2 type transport system permease protein/lipopolysaccharide transport system permease protein
MSVDAPRLEVPPPELLYNRRVSLLSAIKEMWAAREITRSLAERGLRSRYKQAVLGFAWALLTPFVLMLAFTVLFDRVANIDFRDVPGPLFSYMGLIPWTFFSGAVSAAAASIISNISLINKVPCPREVFPLSGVAVSGFDATLSLLVLLVMFPVLGFMPKLTSLWVPVITLVLLAFVTGCAILIAVLVVYVRDIRTALPLGLQFGLFVTPVAFPFYDFVPEAWRGLYSFVNPLGPIIDSYRRTVLYGQAPDFTYLGLGALGSLVILLGGYWLFKRMESGIADVA